MGINQLGFGIKSVGRANKDGLALHEIIDLKTGTQLVIHLRHMTTEEACAAIEEYVIEHQKELRILARMKSNLSDKKGVSDER